MAPTINDSKTLVEQSRIAGEAASTVDDADTADSLNRAARDLSDKADEVEKDATAQADAEKTAADQEAEKTKQAVDDTYGTSS